MLTLLHALMGCCLIAAGAAGAVSPGAAPSLPQRMLLQQQQGCVHPLGGPGKYRLGEKPAAHEKRFPGGRWQDRNAVDFLAPEGTPVFAVTGGTACAPPACVFGKTPEEQRDRFSLNSFTLLGDDGKKYYYTHVQRILVKPGQTIKRGQQVAAVGAYQGRNAHLHLATDRGSACEVLSKCSPPDKSACY